MGNCWCWINNTLIALQKLSIIMTSQFTHLFEVTLSGYLHFRGRHNLQWWWQLKFSLLFYCSAQAHQKAIFPTQINFVQTKSFPLFFSFFATLSRASTFPKAADILCRFSRVLASKKERKSFRRPLKKGKKGKKWDFIRISCNKETTLFWPEIQGFFFFFCSWINISTRRISRGGWEMKGKRLLLSQIFIKWNNGSITSVPLSCGLA